MYGRWALVRHLPFDVPSATQFRGHGLGQFRAQEADWHVLHFFFHVADPRYFATNRLSISTLSY